MIAAMPGVAHAGGFLDFLFGSQHSAPPPPAITSYAEPAAPALPSPSGRETVHRDSDSGRRLAFCVRLCDGENFPMEHFANATPVETCRAHCPASRTKVFYGSSIDNAVGRDGARYADLDNAFVYRKHLVANCTCNGRDAFGLAPFAMADDPTLRPGDIVVADKGPMAYAGRRGQTATYTPVDPVSVARELNPMAAPPGAARHVEPGAREPGRVAETQIMPPADLPALMDLRGQAAR